MVETLPHLACHPERRTLGAPQSGVSGAKDLLASIASIPQRNGEPLAITCEVSLTNRQHHVWLELTIRLIESAAASENRITNANIPSADSPALLSLQ